MSRYNRREALKRFGSAGVALGIAGCVQQLGGGGGGGPLPIGAFAPVTGAGSALGPGHQAGFNAAVEDLNEAGGPLGREIDGFNRDTETKPDRAVQKLNDLISEEDIEAFVGAWSSGVSTTLAPVAADNRIMQVSHGSTSPVLAEAGYADVDGEEMKFFGRTSPNDAQQGLVMGLTLDDIVEVDSVAFMHVDNPYGAGLAEKASEAFSGETTAMIGYSKQTSDYSSTLEKAFADDPDAFGLIAYPANGQAILKQWDRGGYGGELVMTESMDAPSTLQEITDIVEGSHMTSLSPQRGQSYEYFEQQISEEELVVFSAHAYDALVLISLAMEQGGEASGVTVSQNILDVSRPPGTEVYAGPDGFSEAQDLIADGEDINYQGASSPADLTDAYEPINRFAVFKFGANAEKETVRTVEKEFFEDKL